MRIDSPIMTNAVATGSFTGSFSGDGSNLTGITHYTDSDTLAYINSINVLSGSDGYTTDVELNASSSALIQGYTDADTSLSSSLAADIATNASGISTNSTSITSLSSSVASDISAIDTAVPAIIDNSGTPAFNTGITKAEVLTILNVEDGADITDTANVTSAGALMDSEVTSLSGIKTLTVPDSTTISSFGASLVDDADASAARTTLGVDQAGTDNSTDVTLVTTSHDYLSLSGQAITLGTIDISDDTNFAISDTTGQTGINLTLTGDTLSGVVSGLGTSDNVQFNNLTVAGNLTVSGTTTSINSTNLDVTDKLISINRGGSTAASADGGGLFISGANESMTWDNGNSRFNFSDDLNVAGNITVTGTVDGVDIDALNTTVGNIDTSVPAIIDSSGTPALNTGITEAEIKTLLNLEIGTDVQAYNSTLAAVAGGTYTGDDSITTVGTIGTGTWQGTAIGDSYISSATAWNAKLDSAGTIATNDYAKYDASGDLVGRSYSEVKTDLSLNNVENTALSTYTGNGGALDNQYITNGAGYITGYTETDTLASVTGRGATTSTDITVGDIFTIKGGTPYVQWKNAANTRLGYIQHDETDLVMASDTGKIVIDPAGNATDVSGSLSVTGDIISYASSDKEFKDNITPIENALEKVEALGGYEFDWNDNQEVYSGHDIGVIAQEVEAVLPELVNTRDNGYKAVKYEKLTAVLIQAVKELSARVKELENK